jgi:hypothetical protein
MSTKYPHLSRALGDENGYFNPADPSTAKSMCGLLNELNNLLSTDYELILQSISNKPITYVRVPRTSSDNAFTNSKEWVDVVTAAESNLFHGTLVVYFHLPKIRTRLSV